MLRRILCWWRTGHSWEAIGSQMLRSGPHYVYQCRSCGKWKWVPWP